MSENYRSKKKENKNVKALFSVLCLCIIALGLIVNFSMNARTAGKNAVNKNTTLRVSTTEVQRAVTVEDTVKESTTEKETKKKTGSKKQAVTMEQGAENTPYKGKYDYPVSETVIKGYSEELTFDETMGDYRAHAAVDFAGSEGDEVKAINAGIVINTYNDSMLGQVAEIDHGGKLIVRYAGLKSISVKMGTRVDRGDKIGTLGSVPGESMQDTHLHLEARIDGKLVNPLDVMGKTE